MFEKFGEFDSVEELNRAAAAQKAEGDIEALLILAKENGIDEEDALDYFNCITEELATPLMAAYGKLDIEAAELKPEEIMDDWLQYIKVRCSEDAAMAAAVRKKGKSLRGCLAALITWSMNNAKPVDKDILKQLKINYNVTLGIPGMGRAKKLITEYYMK